MEQYLINEGTIEREFPVLRGMFEENIQKEYPEKEYTASPVVTEKRVTFKSVRYPFLATAKNKSVKLDFLKGKIKG